MNELTNFPSNTYKDLKQFVDTCKVLDLSENDKEFMLLGLSKVEKGIRIIQRMVDRGYVKKRLRIKKDNISNKNNI